MHNPMAYQLAQSGMASLKSAIFSLLDQCGDDGLRNVDIGKALGIYGGHIGHEGHIPRTVLAIMESEGVVVQRADKKWILASFEKDFNDEEKY